MDIYFTEIVTGWRLTLCMLPEKLKCNNEAQFQSYDIINLGEIKLPSGTKLATFSWSGTLPGESRQSASFIKSDYYHTPDEVIKIWERWRNNGTKLRLMVTETPINCDVYLDSYSAEATGGNGDFDYDISLVEAKDIKIYTIGELSSASASATNSMTGTTSSNNSKTRPASSKSSATTYTVKSGDSLWTIAQKKLGNGGKYMEIYNLNKDKIKNPSVISVGQILTLPS